MLLAEASADFDLPPELEASEPPEARGLARDEVRLLVSWRDEAQVVHASFRDLDQFLGRGDVLVVNTSATLKAAVPAVRIDGHELELHLSTRRSDGFWVVELREPDGISNRPFRGARAGETLGLPGGGAVHLLASHRRTIDLSTNSGSPRAKSRGGFAQGARLWQAELQLPIPLLEYLDTYGEPIRYSYVRDRWPIEMYQTVFANEPGSAEMPSAARPFTTRLVTRLVARGIQFAPLVLHTGVASLEEHEPPYEEYYRVERETADLVNAARAAGHRVIAVGTTSVRALETVSDQLGTVHPGEGWTDLVITPNQLLRSVDGLLTGFHEPKATHLAMLEALNGSHEELQRVYGEAIQHGYLWHEFGDAHLLLKRHT